MLFLTTTGSDVVVPELGIAIVHPTTDFQIDTQFSPDEIGGAASLTTAITSGVLIWRKVAAGAIQTPSNYDPDYVDIQSENTGGLADDRTVTFKDLPPGASFGSPVTIGTANVEGVQTSVARSDHVHAHGDQTVGTLHAVATTSVNGFMSAADKTKLDALRTKSGVVAAVTFTGSPKKATVTFSAAFPSTAYSINITGADARSWTIESKLASSFVINANANQALTGEVSWQAQLNGEV
jgi:hypothetical protein